MNVRVLVSLCDFRYAVSAMAIVHIAFIWYVVYTIAFAYTWRMPLWWNAPFQAYQSQELHLVINYNNNASSSITRERCVLCTQHKQKTFVKCYKRITPNHFEGQICIRLFAWDICVKEVYVGLSEALKIYPYNKHAFLVTSVMYAMQQCSNLDENNDEISSGSINIKNISLW